MTEFFNTQYGGRRPGRTAEYYAGDESVGPGTEEPEPYSWLFRKPSAAEGVADQVAGIVSLRWGEPREIDDEGT